MDLIVSLAGATGGVVIGYIVDKFGSWPLAFYLAAGSLLCGALIRLLIDPEKPLVDDLR